MTVTNVNHLKFLILPKSAIEDNSYESCLHIGRDKGHILKYINGRFLHEEILFVKTSYNEMLFRSEINRELL